MPPLHEALIEVHRQYKKASRAAKDMAEIYKKATAAADVLNAKYNRKQEENQRLKEQLRRNLEALEKARDQILQVEEHSRLLVSDPQLQQKLEEAKKAKGKQKLEPRRLNPKIGNWKLN